MNDNTNNGIRLGDFYNSHTLNIFSDASIIKRYNGYSGCYGAIAVNRDSIIDNYYRVSNDTTCANSEIKGLRSAISLATKWSNHFRVINIFSDSQISIFGLKSYIYRWKFKNGMLCNGRNDPVANQDVFIEAHYMLKDLDNMQFNSVSIYHQAAHVNDKFNAIVKASRVFRNSNNINGTVDLNFIRYISLYNDYVDNTTRSILRRSNLRTPYIDPIYFYTEGKINRY